MLLSISIRRTTFSDFEPIFICDVKLNFISQTSTLIQLKFLVKLVEVDQSQCFGKRVVHLINTDTVASRLMGNMANWPSPRLQSRSHPNCSEIFFGSLPNVPASALLGDKGSFTSLPWPSHNSVM